jgi:hypothetical protein
LPSQELGGLGVSEIKKVQFEGVVLVAGESVEREKRPRRLRAETTDV